jgi:membrane-associated phospholipid phosphatase
MPLQHETGARCGVRSSVVSRLKTFDLEADRALERLRGRRPVDLLFSGASAAADFSIIWEAIGLGYGLVIRRDVGQTLLFCGLIGAESLVVNQGIKQLFRRRRPTERGDARFRVRKPRSSSFPSGHASSAFFAGTLLTAWVGLWSLPVWLVASVVVGISRAYVRIHHASDVIAGALTGLSLAGITLLTPASDVFRG